ncbi:MAG: helix-turn-helix transcriptional regulator [Eubacterium sp.]|nr:helix-turn-helix transcriptional regulator [Eubacterium sp.]
MDNNEEKKTAKKQSKARSKESVSSFAKTLVTLRNERNISQKKASADLGISQALLSHYEKGIRECGLDFVIRCSEYYGVTTDYLLGVSNSRTGIDLSLDEGNDDGVTISTIAKGTNMLLDVIGASKNKNAIRFCLDYYTLCLYRGSLTMAKAGVLPKEMFKLDLNLGRELASAAIAIEDAKFVFVEDKSRTGSDSMSDTPIQSLIELAEEKILSNFYIE